MNNEKKNTVKNSSAKEQQMSVKNAQQAVNPRMESCIKPPRQDDNRH
ncbi:hypothetical protein [Clostridium merdae]|nr:hypothetical protein [Clostridium merdae]